MMTVPRFIVTGLLIVLLAATGCRRGGSSSTGNATTPPDAGAQAALPPAPLPRADGGNIVPEDPASLDAMNDAIGVMGMFRYREAAEAFGRLATDHPQWLDAQVDLAIATLNRQEEGDEQAALERLEAVIAADPDHLRARYTAGILFRRSGRAEDARASFQYVVDQDPRDPYALYFLGQELAGEDPEAALELFDRAIEINPYLRSPYYGAFQLLARQGRIEEAAEYQANFDRLVNNPLASVIREVYTRMGPKAEVGIGDDGESRPPIAREGDRSTLGPSDTLLAAPPEVSWRTHANGRPVSITAVDIDMDGDIDLFIPGIVDEPDGAINAVIINEGAGAFRLDLDHVLAHVMDVNGACWGDFDNDELTDVYLLRRGPNQLWRQTTAGRWQDGTDSTTTSGGDMDTVDGMMVDADHDGDLDIFCVNADGPNELLNNNLDGTFTAIASERGIAGAGASSRQVLVADLDLDRDADLIVINEEPPHEVYVNDRLWRYRDARGFDAFRQSQIVALVQADVNADGFPDLHALGPSGEITTWSANTDGEWIASDVTTQPRFARPDAQRLAAADIDGQGQFALLAGPPDEDTDYLGWATVQLGAGRGPSIVAYAPETGVSVWFGDRGYITLEMRGVEDTTSGPPPARTNRSAIGARIAARAGTRWMILDTFRPDSGPGQGLQPLAIGMQGFEHLDYLAIDWPDGVFQSEVHGQSPLGDAPPRDFSVGAHAVIGELQRIKSSCPVLFVWDGEQYQFVSDILGVGGIGYMVAPGEYAPPRPWENFLFPADLLKPRDGSYVIKVGEPMEEVCYLDSAALVAYDLPPGWSMTLDERMSIAGPEPTGEPRFYRRQAMPIKATNERGEDVAEHIQLADHQAAPVGDLDSRFLGRLAGEHVLTLEFADPITPTGESEHPMLVIDGWVEYPYSQTMFAAWQAGAEYEAPTLEARDAEGRWVTLLEQFGYPAGMPRQMSVPLDDLPPGCTALRLRTNQEIYWDRIAVAWAEPCPDARETVLRLDRADLRRTGFALRTTGPQRLPHYDYQHRPALADARFTPGQYTRLGAVEPLVDSSDAAPVIFGPGEETHLEFAASPAPTDRGWTRRFVLQTTGWCKDMDLYTSTGETVGPIPGEAISAEAKALLTELTTRTEAGE